MTKVYDRPPGRKNCPPGDAGGDLGKIVPQLLLLLNQEPVLGVQTIHLGVQNVVPTIAALAGKDTRINTTALGPKYTDNTHLITVAPSVETTLREFLETHREVNSVLQAVPAYLPACVTLRLHCNAQRIIILLCSPSRFPFEQQIWTIN
jgi:hypothetical protein